MAKTKEFTVNFNFERATKGAHRLQEVDDNGKVLTTNDDAVIGSLYLRKTKVGDAEPKRVEMTIKVFN